MRPLCTIRHGTLARHANHALSRSDIDWREANAPVFSENRCRFASLARAANAPQTTYDDMICRNSPIAFRRLRGRREFDLLKIRSIFAMTPSSLGVVRAHAGTTAVGGALQIQISNRKRTNTAPRSRGAFRPSFALLVPPSRSEGAGNAGRPMRPQRRVRRS